MVVQLKGWMSYESNDGERVKEGQRDIQRLKIVRQGEGLP